MREKVPGVGSGHDLGSGPLKHRFSRNPAGLSICRCPGRVSSSIFYLPFLILSFRSDSRAGIFNCNGDHRVRDGGAPGDTHSPRAGGRGYLGGGQYYQVERFTEACRVA